MENNNEIISEEAINAILKQQRDKRFTDSPQLSLGQIISEIEKLGTKTKNGDHKIVVFDFGTAIPTTLHSWRGSYNELALGYKLTGYDDPGNQTETAACNFLRELKWAIGKEFTGWKGGEFKMSADTPVWVANKGNSGNTAIVGVTENEYGRLILLTAYCNY